MLNIFYKIILLISFFLVGNVIGETVDSSNIKTIKINSDDILKIEVKKDIREPYLILTKNTEKEIKLKWFGECAIITDKDNNKLRYCARIAEVGKYGNNSNSPKLCLYYDEKDTYDNIDKFSLMHVDSDNPYNLKDAMRVSLEDLNIGFKYFIFDYKNFGDYLTNYIKYLQDLSIYDKSRNAKTKLNAYYKKNPLSKKHKPLGCFELSLPQLINYCLVGPTSKKQVITKNCYLSKDILEKYQNGELSEANLSCKYIDINFNYIVLNKNNLDSIPSPFEQDVKYPIDMDNYESSYIQDSAIDYPGRSINLNISNNNNTYSKENLEKLATYLYYKFTIMSKAGEISNVLGCSSKGGSYLASNAETILNTIGVSNSVNYKARQLNLVCNIIKGQSSITEDKYAEIISIYDNAKSEYNLSIDIIKIIDYYLKAKYYTSNNLYEQMSCDTQIDNLSRGVTITQGICNYISSDYCTSTNIYGLCNLLDDDRKNLKYIQGSDSEIYYLEAVRDKTPKEMGLCIEMPKY